jgi:Bacteriocin-protection, YdeI or OmpD-Associated/Domain of unknown function (DUF1905)
MKPLTFRGTIQLRGINPYIAVDAAVSATLKSGWRKPIPVLLRINGKPPDACRTNMMPAGDGSFYLYLNGRVRSEAGVSVGQLVDVELEFDRSYKNGPLHPVPGWFKQALKQNPSAQNNWNALPPSRKKEVLRYFANLKSADAQARNLNKAIHALSGQATRFMARDWKNGA